jgi:hypothetical protein
MGKNLMLILLGLVAISCRQTNEELKDRLVNADSVAINYFTGSGSMDTVAAVKIVRDKANIERLASLISLGTIDPNYKCGVDGSLHFFKFNKVVQDIDFRMNEESCMQFSFLQQGEFKASTLSAEAKELLEVLKK